MFSRTMTTPLRACLLTSVLALAGAGIGPPAQARSAYDGPWSIVITTRGGACQPSIRYGVDISNGRIINPAAGGPDVQGRVTPRGAVSVTVRSGGAWAVGSGRLGRSAGGGAWRGQGSSGLCDGTWVAQRRGPATAQTTGAAPSYYGSSSAPGPAAPSVATCQARFRSYDPATGTYLGRDGRRHRCP